MNRDEYWDSVDVSANSDDADGGETKMDGDQFVCESFEDKLYVPKRSYRKHVKPWHLGLSVVVLVVIIVIIVAASSGRKASVVIDGNKAAAKYAYSGLIICEGNTLWNYNLEDESMKIVHKTDKIIGSFDFYEDTTFWSEPNASKILSRSGGSNGSHKSANVTFEDSRFKVQAVAVDHFTRKLYAIDKSTGTAIVVDLQNNRYGILMTDLKQPEDILLDPSKGVMFILQPTESILRLNMDGTSLHEVVRSTIYITAISLDYANEMIYGIYNHNTILRTDYLGTSRDIILKDRVSIVGLSVSNGQLFWLWPSYGPHNSTLWSCRINNEVHSKPFMFSNDNYFVQYCLDHKVHPLELGNVTSIKSLSHRTDVLNASNPCTLHKNICQHLCLLSSKINAGRSCGCYAGWESQADPRGCQAVKEFLLYVIGRVVRARILNFDRDSFTEAFLPVALTTESLNAKGSLDFDYDARNDIFYVSDDVHLYRTSLRRPSNQTILLTAPDTHVIEDLAFDWLSMNLYYSNCSKSDVGSHSIRALNVREDRRFARDLLNFTYRDGFGLKGCPYATVIDAQEGNVFFSAEEGSYRSIYRTTLNGTRLTMQSSNIEYVHQYRLLAIDYGEKRLYWIHRSGLETRIRHVNFDGSDEKYVHVGDVPNARNIYIYDQWMYLSTDSSIWRGNKRMGNFHRAIPRIGSDLTEPVSAMKIVNLTLEATMERQNPCFKDNGGCEQFCYSSPRKTCGCVDDSKLRDSASCT